MIIVAAFLIGTGKTLVDNAAQAILPQLVDRNRLAVANGRLYAGQVIAGQFLGQGVGGALFAVAVGLPFGVDAATFRLRQYDHLAAVANRLAEAARAPARLRLMLLGDIGQVVRWLIGQRLLRGLLARPNPPVTGAQPPARSLWDPADPPLLWDGVET